MNPNHSSANTSRQMLITKALAREPVQPPYTYCNKAPHTGAIKTLYATNDA